MAVSQKQRDFLIGKVKENKGKLLREIEAALPQQPDMNTYVTLAIMSDKFVIKSEEEIRQGLRERAAKLAQRGGAFITSDYEYREGAKQYSFYMKLPADLVIELPEDYQKEYDKYEQAQKVAKVQKEHIESKSDTLITRITLASNYQFEQIVEEVDSMGSLSIQDMVVKKMGPQEVRLALSALDEEDRKLLN